jgi:hypothetical protein
MREKEVLAKSAKLAKEDEEREERRLSARRDAENAETKKEPNTFLPSYLCELLACFARFSFQSWMISAKCLLNGTREGFHEVGIGRHELDGDAVLFEG